MQYPSLPDQPGRDVLAACIRFGNHACFSDLEYAAGKQQTRRDRFLGESEVIPRLALVAEIEPFYPKGSGQ